jgi:hypothetical protein
MSADAFCHGNAQRSREKGRFAMAEDRSIPYVLAGREIPEGPAPDGLKVYPAPCIFCGTPLHHVDDGGNGSTVEAVVDGLSHRYMR